jgi:hypothetical protein
MLCLNLGQDGHLILRRGLDYDRDRDGKKRYPAKSLVAYTRALRSVIC